MLNFSEMGTQIRIAWRAKYKMLPVILECSSMLQVKTFYQLQACTYSSVSYSGGVNTCWNPNFYFVVLNQFCDFSLKIRMAYSTL